MFCFLGTPQGKKKRYRSVSKIHLVGTIPLTVSQWCLQKCTKGISAHKSSLFSLKVYGACNVKTHEFQGLDLSLDQIWNQLLISQVKQLIIINNAYYELSHSAIEGKSKKESSHLAETHGRPSGSGSVWQQHLLATLP